MSRVTLDEVADSLYKTFKKHQERYGLREEGEAISFWHTIREHFEEIGHESVIDRIALEHTDRDYVRHVNEKCGLEIGSLINKRNDLHHSWEEDSIMGKRVRKQVYVLRLEGMKEVK